MLIVKCCICKRVRCNGKWMEPSDVDSKILVSHTYCPECLKKVKEKEKAKETERLTPSIL